MGRATHSKLRENRKVDETVPAAAEAPFNRKSQLDLPATSISKLAMLHKRSGFLGDPDEIAGMDWAMYWSDMSEIH